MLSGCPDCGGNKFQFAPASALEADGQADSQATTSSSSTATKSTAGSTDNGGVTARATKTVRSWVSDDESETDDSFSDWPETAKRPSERLGPASTPDADSPSVESSSSRPSTVDRSSTPDNKPSAVADDEDSAQASARSDIVSPEELPTTDRPDADTPPTADSSAPARETPPDHGRVVSEPDEAQPSLEELRDELNQQFESIKIVSPGQYELNLMELYDREEHIVSLQEDGRYVINVPDSWREGPADEQ